MKKIAFIINVFREDNFHSGGEKLYYELVTKAVNKGFKVDLYCTKYLSDKETPELKPQINKLVIYGNSKDYKYPEKIENLYNKISAQIKNENYDCIIAENITPPLGMAVLQGHSLIHYTSMAGNFLNKAIFYLKKRKFINYQKKWLNQGYKKIFVPSKTLRDEIKNNFNIPDEKFVVAYPGVEIPQQKLDTNFDELISGKREIIFGISAPSFGKKGGYVFLKALSLLKTQGYNFKAKVIYPKFHKNLVLKIIVKISGLASNIEFLDRQSNMSNFYNSVDCVIMPSLLETFGLVALESMAHKKPAIVSSFSGVSEIISDGENGFIFDMKKNAPENLAEKMKYLIDNKNKIEIISQNAFESAKNYSWDKTTETMISNI